MDISLSELARPAAPIRWAHFSAYAFPLSRIAESLQKYLYSGGVLRAKTAFGLFVLGLALNGCGGSSSGSNGNPGGGTAFSEYSANLPDGSPMIIEVLADENGVWAGEFVVATETGAYAHQVGSFEGIISGRNIAATGEIMGGDEFQMNGTINSDGSWSLTRSDIPATLTFRPVPHTEPAQARGEASFNFNTGTNSGRVVLNSTPYAVHNGGEITEYRGKWNNLDATFWSYRSGLGNLVIYVDPMCIATSVWTSYRISDFPTATVASSNGYMTMFSSITRQQVRFRTSVTASP